MPVNITGAQLIIMLYTSSSGSALCTALVKISCVLKEACVIAKDNELQKCLDVYEHTHSRVTVNRDSSNMRKAVGLYKQV